jgi:hypothetical protein
VVNGKLYARGHWYVCEEVKRRGSEYQLTPEEKLEIRRELELSQNKGNGVNKCCESRDPDPSNPYVFGPPISQRYG